MKTVLAIGLLAATFGVREVAREDGPLEPSVRNEVAHAVSRADRWLACCAVTNDPAAIRGDIFGTNGLSATALALKLVSAQRGAGWWLTPSNSAPTRAAVEILKGL